MKVFREYEKGKSQGQECTGMEVRWINLEWIMVLLVFATPFDGSPDDIGYSEVFLLFQVRGEGTWLFSGF